MATFRRNVDRCIELAKSERVAASLALPAGAAD
jgi:hypothetical protein